MQRERRPASLMGTSKIRWELKMPDRAKVAPARRRGLASEAADRVRDAIFDGVYPPGAQLREVELSAALDVSRGPVREALLQLEREGLVRTGWHRGASVTELSAQDISEIDSLRCALEELAVTRVIAHATDGDLDRLEALASRMDNSQDDLGLVRLDIEFHDAVYASADHQRLEAAWQAIRSQVHLFLLTRVRLSSEGYLAQIPEEHHELVVALRARDREKALALFAAHRQHALTVLADQAKEPQ
jgi:DNA-binding GntR family transcriptional regulator